jgi:hypothetical protein
MLTSNAGRQPPWGLGRDRRVTAKIDRVPGPPLLKFVTYRCSPSGATAIPALFVGVGGAGAQRSSGRSPPRLPTSNTETSADPQLET